MELFDVHAFAYVLHSLKQAESACIVLKIGGHGSERPERESFQRGTKALIFAENFFRIQGFEDCLEAVGTAKHHWERPLLDVSAGCEILHRIQLDIVAALKKRAFITVPEGKRKFIDKDDLFGAQVNAAFGAATPDIREAGNCLASGCSTAAVFHLMRAAEVALRAIANDRKVSFANRPLDQQEWGTILGALEGIIKQMRLADGKNWISSSFKEAQVRFYNEAVQELRGFNEAWRRHVSHADVSAFCDSDYAISVFNHVKAFMQKLATRIGETNVMPEYWDTV